MHKLLQRRAVTLFVGHDAQYQSSVAIEACFDALVHGATIIALVDVPGDVSVFTSRAKDWLSVTESEPHFFHRVCGLGNYRVHHEPEALAKAITKITGEIDELVVLIDAARNILPLLPGAALLRQCACLLKYLPVSIVLTASHGPSEMPAPSLHEYKADRIYKVKTGFNATQINLTPIKPPGQQIALGTKMHHKGVMTVQYGEQDA